MKKRLLSLLIALILCLSLVPMTALAAASLSLDQTSYSEGKTITITVSGVTQQMLDDGAYVALYQPGAADEDYLYYMYPETTGTSTLELAAPEIGSYEMRFYDIDSETYEPVRAASVPFSVVAAAPADDTTAPADDTAAPVVAATAPVDAANGDWSAKSIALKNTAEAELMVRVGDIDALNDPDAITYGYNPFTAADQHSHGYP